MPCSMGNGLSSSKSRNLLPHLIICSLFDHHGIDKTRRFYFRGKNGFLINQDDKGGDEMAAIPIGSLDPGQGILRLDSKLFGGSIECSVKNLVVHAEVVVLDSRTGCNFVLLERHFMLVVH